jgi:MGT family glycosyltransferase
MSRTLEIVRIFLSACLIVLLPLRCAEKKVLFVPFPALSHVSFQLDIAAEISHRGYSVAVAITDSYRAAFEERTYGREAQFLSLGRYAVNFEYLSRSTSIQDLSETAFWAGVEIKRMSESLAGHLVDILQAEKPDVLVVDFAFIPAIRIGYDLKIPVIATYSLPAPDDLTLFSYDVDVSLVARTRRLLYVLKTTLAVVIWLKWHGIDRSDVLPTFSRPLFGIHMAFPGYHFPFHLQYPPTHAFVGFTFPDLNASNYNSRDMELKKYLDELPTDIKVVYVAFGSIVKVDPTLLDSVVKGVVNCGNNIHIVLSWPAFESLPPDWPKHRIRVEKWTHQLMVLKHNRTKLFVTHSGLRSMSEAIASHMPVLALPHFADQIGNALLAVKAGFGVWIPSLQDITTKAVENNVNAVFMNYSQFLAAVEHVDRLRELAGGMRRAGDLVESVLVGGVERFKPVDWDLPFWSSYNLDILGIVLITLLGLVVMIYWVIRKCFQVALCFVNGRPSVSSKLKKK